VAGLTRALTGVATVLIIGASRGIGLETVKAALGLEFHAADPAATTGRSSMKSASNRATNLQQQSFFVVEASARTAFLRRARAKNSFP
jgi:NAD(P)-dependent dehydrogenase (short-subunit alcohol dehydrogenase family)